MKYLDESEKLELETFCWNRADSEPRNAAMILLTLASGCRAQELLNLTWQDLDAKRLTLKVKTLKRGRNREIPLSKRLVALLLSLKAASERIFSISYQRLNQIWVLWRPQPISFHALRHTFAMHAFERAKINEVQYMLGHRSMSSTGVYLQVEPSEKRMKQILGFK